MSIETVADRRAMLSDWDEITIWGSAFACFFDADHTEFADVAGHAPAALMLDEDVLAASVLRGARIDRIARFTGQTTGPYRVKALQAAPESQGSSWPGALAGFTLLVLAPED